MELDIPVLQHVRSPEMARFPGVAASYFDAPTQKIDDFVPPGSGGFEYSKTCGNSSIYGLPPHSTRSAW